MKDFKTILICLTAISMSIASHHPQVYEDEADYSKNENVRTARNSESAYRTVHQPPVFNFESARQQDYLRAKYVEQQKMSTVTMVNGMSKSYRHFSQPQNKYKTVGKDTDDWQPFDPKISKQDSRIIPGFHYLKVTKDAKLYKPSLVKVGLIPKEGKLIEGQRNIPNPLIIRNTDLDAAGSESVEKKIEVRQTPKEYNNVVFVHPSQVPDDAGQENPDNIKPETQLTALNDLIGKNPNVQLEGLKRLLVDSSSKNFNIPVNQGAEEHASVTERNLISNIKINPEDNSLSLQTPHLIGKESLEDIQKQLDEAAKIQTQQALARAQQEAQAQVEAQHKAIALAQVQAQKIALENIQKSIYANAQESTAEQNNQDHDTTNNLGNVQAQVNLQPVAVSLPLVSQNKVIRIPKPSTNALENDISVKNLTPQRGTKSHVVSIASGPRKEVALYGNTPAHSFGSKEVLYYAPNHHHQAAAQLQAEKALLSQVQAQNMAILHGRKHGTSAIRQILKQEQISSAEQESSSSIQSEEESKPEATAYQQIILESKEVENVGDEQKDYDDIDDVSNVKCKSSLHTVTCLSLHKAGNCSESGKYSIVKIRKKFKSKKYNASHFIEKRNTKNVDTYQIPDSSFVNQDDSVSLAMRRHSYVSKIKSSPHSHSLKQHPAFHPKNHQINVIPLPSFTSVHDKLPHKKENSPFNVLVINNNFIGSHPKKHHRGKRRRKHRKLYRAVVLYK